jgi:hypothetical protein
MEEEVDNVIFHDTPQPIEPVFINTSSIFIKIINKIKAQITIPTVFVFSSINIENEIKLLTDLSTYTPSCKLIYIYQREHQSNFNNYIQDIIIRKGGYTLHVNKFINDILKPIHKEGKTLEIKTFSLIPTKEEYIQLYTEQNFIDDLLDLILNNKSTYYPFPPLYYLSKDKIMNYFIKQYNKWFEKEKKVELKRENINKKILSNKETRELIEKML